MSSSHKAYEETGHFRPICNRDSGWLQNSLNSCKSAPQGRKREFEQQNKCTLERAVIRKTKGCFIHYRHTSLRKRKSKCQLLTPSLSKERIDAQHSCHKDKNVITET